MGRARTFPKSEINIQEGLYISHNGRSGKVRKILGVDLVLIEYTDNNETAKTHPWDLQPYSEPTPSEPSVHRTSDLVAISNEEFKEAKAIYESIKPLIFMEERTREDVKKVADQNGVDTSTIYAWIKHYCETGNISALVKRKKGPAPGSKRLSPEVEAIIETCYEKSYLQEHQPPPIKFLEDVEDACKLAGLKAPHRNTLRNRLKTIPPEVAQKRRGNTEIADRLKRPMPGEFPEANHPLECVQIDHCVLDIQLVYKDTRKPIGIRPWLTLIIDAFSRMILGYFLSLHRPSSFAAGAAIYMAIMPKKPLLQKLGLPGEWPVFGKMKSIHADNAREFKGHMLELACSEHDIISVLRPVKRPEYGAYIERAIGNVAREMQKKKGATQRKPDLNKDYDPVENAIYTLDELEVELVDWIVNSYHVNLHSELGTTPLRRFQEGILGNDRTPGTGIPPIPTNHEKLRLDFLPFERRVVHNYGVEIDGMFFYDPVLNTWINAVKPENPKHKRKFIFRWDPRSIRFIWFYDPDLEQYFRIPTRDPSRPDISWTEYKEYRKLARKEGEGHVDEDATFAFRQRARAREEQAAEKTKLARQNKPPKETALRSPNATSSGSKVYAATPPVEAKKPSIEKPSEDIFSEPLRPFDDIEV